MAGHSKGFGRWRTWTPERKGLAQRVRAAAPGAVPLWESQFIPHLWAEELQKRLPWAEELLQRAVFLGADAVQRQDFSWKAEYGWSLDFNPKEEHGNLGSGRGQIGCQEYSSNSAPY